MENPDTAREHFSLDNNLSNKFSWVDSYVNVPAVSCISDKLTLP